MRLFDLKLFRTTAFALSLGYALLFALSSGIVFVLTFDAVEERSRDQIEDLVANAVHALGSRDPEEIARVLHTRRRDDRAEFCLLDAQGNVVAGGLRPEALPPIKKGWVEIVHLEHDGDREPMLGRWFSLEKGAHVFAAAELEDHEELIAAVSGAFAWAGGLSLLLAIAGGILTSAAFLRRLERFNQTAGRIIEGALDERVPLRGTGDELDRLAQRINSMLDRVQALVESLRQVSSDVAHDLRTPLTRLRHGLERAQLEARDLETYRAAVDRALAECDQLLAIFSALLRIAQIESGTRRAGFADVDLSAVFETIAETYGPVAEDAGRRLTTKIAPGVRLHGDRQLLMQMLANLIDNAIQHTPRGTSIQLELAGEQEAIQATIADDGPGIPEADRTRVFGRFVRLESSRTTPGSGLGLSLVAAVAELHGFAVELGDAQPGTIVRLRRPK